MGALLNQSPEKKFASVAPEGGCAMNSSMDNHLDSQKFSMHFNVAIGLLLFLTAGLAHTSGGGYINILLKSAIVIILIAIALKEMLLSAGTKHE